jgi:choline dehydrogenase
VLDRAGVGDNLQDHLQLRAIYKITGARTLNATYHSPFGRVGMALQYALLRRGPLTMAPSQLGLFTRSDPSRERANIQFHVQPLSLDRFGEPLHRFPAFTASVTNVQPTSRGHLTLHSADPQRRPRSRRIICRPTRTAASPPIPSARCGASRRSPRWRRITRMNSCPGRPSAMTRRRW